MPDATGGATVLALTGTPGTGKTTIAAALAARGWRVVDLKALADAAGLLAERDPRRDTALVDVDAASAALQPTLRRLRATGAPVALEGHWSHDVDGWTVACVLRCHPATLEARLAARGWSPQKARENAEAEALGVVADEAAAAGEAFEVDTTDATADETADALLHALRHPPARRPAGALDWTRLAPGWF